MTDLLTEAPPEPEPEVAGRRFAVTRRGLQIALGVVWLLDGALQLQPFMFGSGFASQVIAPTGDGQPGWVAGAVHWAANLIGSSPTAWNAVFAGVQLAIGFGLLIRPLVRLALLGSIVWGLGVWYLGEGIGGIASGHASLLTGAPGAVLLYVVLAVLAWPRTAKAELFNPTRTAKAELSNSTRTAEPDPDAPAGWRGWLRQDGSAPPAAWTPVAWAVVWIGGAVLQALPGQDTAGGVADSLTGMSMPSWLMGSVTGIANGFTKLGSTALWLLVAVFVVIGVGGLLGGRIRAVAAWAGIVLGVLIWVFGEGFANLFSGQATDPNSGPLLALLGVALLGVAPVTVTSDARRTVLATVSAVAVVGVGLLLWVNTRPVPVGPPPALTLTGLYTPVGDGGQVYFVLTNKGDGPDTLTAAGTEFQTATKAKGVMVCADAACASDGTVTIPAHSSVQFDATGPHVVVHGMGALAAGNPPLQLTLTFQRSGVLHVLAPVGSPANLTQNDIMTYGFMGGSQPGMGDMSGMSGMPTTTMPGMGH